MNIINSRFDDYESGLKYVPVYLSFGSTFISKISTFEPNFYFLVSEFNLPRELGLNPPITEVVDIYTAFFNDDFRINDPLFYLEFLAKFSTSTANDSSNVIREGTKCAYKISSSFFYYFVSLFNYSVTFLNTFITSAELF